MAMPEKTVWLGMDPASLCLPAQAGARFGFRMFCAVLGFARGTGRQ
jgi:hypothetical protein